MSEVRVILRDPERELSGTCHGSDAARVVAALSAEPESIAELEAGLARFMETGGRTPFAGFRKGLDEEPWDAGLVIIDLAARLIASENSYFSPAMRGSIQYHDGNRATDLEVQYLLPEDWRIEQRLDFWRGLADDRRAQRLALPPLDFRAVLYGQALLEYIARECLCRLKDQPLPKAPAEEDHASASPLDDDRGDDERDAIRQIHADWMLAPREDLRGQSPRQLLLARRDFIDCDLQDRQHQWTFQGACPPPLHPESFAFQYAGCGTHENVIYYYMVRSHLWSCRDRLGELKTTGRLEYLMAGDFLIDEVPRLAQERDRWLESPDPEFHGRTPRSIVDHERRRIPEGMSGHEAIIDHDCLLCQMMADGPGGGPVFWHLDGCNMDDDFAFSHHLTLAEWEAKQREYEEFSRRFNAQQQAREELGVKYPASGYSDPDYAWQRSFVTEEAADVPFVAIRLFAIGSQLAELIVDLKEAQQERPLIDRLHLDIGNLREICHADDAVDIETMIQPVLDRFCNSLDDVAAQQTDLQEQCNELRERLQRFLQPPRPREESPDWEDDIPF